MSNIENLDNKKKSCLTVTLSVSDLDNIKNVLRVINNNIVANGRVINPYNHKLLTALLGKDYKEQYAVGKVYMEVEK